MTPAQSSLRLPIMAPEGLQDETHDRFSFSIEIQSEYGRSQWCKVSKRYWMGVELQWKGYLMSNMISKTLNLTARDWHGPGARDGELPCCTLLSYPG